MGSDEFVSAVEFQRISEAHTPNPQIMQCLLNISINVNVNLFCIYENIIEIFYFTCRKLSMHNLLFNALNVQPVSDIVDKYNIRMLLKAILNMG